MVGLMRVWVWGMWEARCTFLGFELWDWASQTTVTNGCTQRQAANWNTIPESFWHCSFAILPRSHFFHFHWRYNTISAGFHFHTYWFVTVTASSLCEWWKWYHTWSWSLPLQLCIYQIRKLKSRFLMAMALHCIISDWHTLHSMDPCFDKNPM